MKTNIKIIYLFIELFKIIILLNKILDNIRKIELRLINTFTL